MRLTYTSVTGLCKKNHLSSQKIPQITLMLNKLGVRSIPYRKFRRFEAKTAQEAMATIIEGFRKKASRPTRIGKPHSISTRRAKVVTNGLSNPAQLDLFSLSSPPTVAHSISERLARLEKKVDTLIKLWS